MNDQSQLMNHHQVRTHSQLMMNQSQKMMNESQMLMSHSQMLNKVTPSQMVNQQPPPPQLPPSQAQLVNQLNQQPLMVSQAVNSMIAQPQMMNQSKMMGQNYGQWPQPPPNMPLPPMNAMKFANPMNQMYGIAKPGRSNWKGKKPMDNNNKRKDIRRKDKVLPGGGGASGVAFSGPGTRGYQPPTLYELEQQNRLKAKRFYPKKKFNRMGPYAHAPRNTTSFLIRAKKSGGIASLVSPCPFTPAVLPTPIFSPSRESLVDMAKEEWGVDGYGSMKGLIRLRSPGHDEAVDDYEEEDEGGSSESDVEEHVEVERRLDHDLSRFEMIYPNSGVDYHNVLENRVDDQDTHIAQLEEENLILKERLYLMESELGELRRRLVCLERQNQVVEDINEEVVENVSENDSEGLRNFPRLGEKHNEEVDYVHRNGTSEIGVTKDDNDEMLHKELKELDMKDVHSEAVENNLKQDTGVVSEGLTMDRKGEIHGGELDMEEPGVEKDIGSAVGRKVDNIDEGVKNEHLGSICIGEVMSDKVTGNDPSEEGVNQGTIIGLKDDEVMVAGAQAEGSNEQLDKEAAGDVCMGDALPVDKVVDNDASHD